MKRLAMEKLVEWKNKKRRKSLVIMGARQVGKTWLMKEFGRQYYRKVAYVSFYNKYHPATSIRLSLLNYKDQGWMVNIPLYAVCNM